MRKTDALWMENRDGKAAVALAPLASPPSRIEVKGADAVLLLADGPSLRLADAAAADLRRIASSVGTISVFEVDALGTVRRATDVALSA